MKLVRAVTMYFVKLTPDWSHWAMEGEPVTARTININQDRDEMGRHRLLVVAETRLSGWPKQDSEGRVIVPEEARIICETHLETVANIVGVANGCGKTIASASPCIALVAETEAERSWLEASAGMALGFVTVNSPVFPFPLRSLDARWFADRQDGVALLCDALGHSSGAAQLRGLLLLFERAFGLPVTRLDKRLTLFLRGTNQNFSRQEIREWVDVRHPLSHADQEGPLIRDAWTLHLLGRMREAAYDVLFNKETWHDRSRTRREVWRPPACTTAAEGKSIKGVAGGDWGLTAQLFDPFRSFPMDLGAVLSPPPSDWWTKEAEDHAATAPGEI